MAEPEDGNQYDETAMAVWFTTLEKIPESLHSELTRSADRHGCLCVKCISSVDI